jgi:hypothetical protein
MKLDQLPIKVFSHRAIPGRAIYEFQLISAASTALPLILEALPHGGELLVPAPMQKEDCYLQARRLGNDFQVKLGCHGRSGTWRPATLREAIEWLIPGEHALETKRSGWQLEMPA